MANLGKRPEASQISFDDSCFETIGFREVFMVANPCGWGYPKRFEKRDEAEKYARKTNGVLTSHQEPIRQRVRWN